MAIDSEVFHQRLRQLSKESGVQLGTAVNMADSMVRSIYFLLAKYQSPVREVMETDVQELEILENLVRTNNLRGEQSGNTN